MRADLRAEALEDDFVLLEGLLALWRREGDRLVEVPLDLLERLLVDLDEREVLDVLRAITCAL